MKQNEPALIIEVLQALYHLLSLDSSVQLVGEQQVAYQFELAGGLDELERLQMHPNTSIYNECERVISTYFKDDQNPAVSSSNNYMHDQN